MQNYKRRSIILEFGSFHISVLETERRLPVAGSFELNTRATCSNSNNNKNKNNKNNASSLTSPRQCSRYRRSPQTSNTCTDRTIAISMDHKQPVLSLSIIATQSRSYRSLTLLLLSSSSNPALRKSRAAWIAFWGTSIATETSSK